MNKLLEILSAESLAQVTSAARREVIDRLHEFDEASASVAELEQKGDELEREIADLETRKSVLDKIDHRRLLAASEAAIVMQSIYVKPLSPDARRKLEDSYLRASGYIMVNPETFRDASGMVLVRKPALDRAFTKAVEPVWSEIVAGLKAREAVVLGRCRNRNQPSRKEPSHEGNTSKL